MFCFSLCGLQSNAVDVYTPINIADWTLPQEPMPFPLLNFDPRNDVVATTAVCAVFAFRLFGPALANHCHMCALAATRPLFVTHRGRHYNNCVQPSHPQAQCPFSCWRADG